MSKKYLKMLCFFIFTVVFVSLYLFKFAHIDYDLSEKQITENLKFAKQGDKIALSRLMNYYRINDSKDIIAEFWIKNKKDLPQLKEGICSYFYNTASKIQKIQLQDSYKKEIESDCLDYDFVKYYL